MKLDTLEYWVQRTLPQVYDDSLSFYELLGKVVAKLNEVIEQSNEYFSKDLQVYVGDILTTWKNDGTLDTIINQSVFNDLQTQINEVEAKTERYYTNVLEFGGKGDGIVDNTVPIRAAISDLVAKGGGVLYFGYGTYMFSDTISVPERVQIKGILEDDSTTQFDYRGVGYAFQTDPLGTHLRNAFNNFSLNLNYNASGIKIGMSQIDRDNGKIPRQSNIKNVRIGELGVGKYGIRLENASHILIESTRSAYGNGGIGLSIWNDNSNAGVVTAIDSTFGRVNESQVGLEIDSTFQVGLDSYTFIGCYFGGAVPIRLGLDGTTTTNVRNVVFNAPHIEPTKAVTQGVSQVQAVQIGRVNGLIVNGATLAGFNDPLINGFVFKGIAKGVHISGVDANEFKGKVFYNEGGADLDNSFIQEATLTGADTAGHVMFNGNFDYVTRLTGKVLKSKTMEATFFSTPLGNKYDWGTANPTADNPLQSWTRGDMRFMKNGAELGTAGSKYTLVGWKATSSGTPGTWVEMRALTGN